MGVKGSGGQERFLAVQFLKNIYIKKSISHLTSLSYDGSGPFTCPFHNPHCIPVRSAVLVLIINSGA